MALDVSLLDFLAQAGRLSADFQAIMREESASSGRPLAQLVVDAGLMDEEEVLHWTAQVRGCEVVARSALMEALRQPSLAEVFPYEILERANVVPVAWESDASQLTVAMADVADIPAQDLLMRHAPAGCRLKCVLAKRSDVRDALETLAPSARRTDSGLSPAGDTPHLHPFLNHILVLAKQQRASDVHFEPEKFWVRIRFRCDGLMKVVQSCHRSLWQTLSVQIKVMAGMDIAQTRQPQDGRFSLPLGGRMLDCRAATHPTLYGEKIVLRLLDPQRALVPLDQLGYSISNLARIRTILRRPEGLIIMTGPTGCGKTTSLYSMLLGLSQETLNIMTLEEPVEYALAGICQSEVKEKSQMTFASGVHSLLRQDPDVILIGEIRDESTADMAVRASMTGHLVLTTLHTIDSLSSLFRLRELKIPLSLLVGVLNGVVAQRLVRMLCVACRGTQDLTADIAKTWGIWPQTSVGRAVGCPACGGTGYSGRKAIAEVLWMDRDLEGLLLDQAPRSHIRSYLAHTGFVTLAEDARQCVLRGETTPDEIQRVLGGM